MNKKLITKRCRLIVLVLTSFTIGVSAYAEVRLKEVARFGGAHDNSLVGYGLVVGLAGTGDSSRSHSTSKAVLNTLKSFGISVSSREISSRNVAAVILTANMPAFSEVGKSIDVNVSSVGDARSLVGGTLLRAPLKAADNGIYALAQGPVSVGGYKYDFNGSMVQKNHPTVGIIPQGGTIERYVDSSMVRDDGRVAVVLDRADYTTAGRVESAINTGLGGNYAEAVSPGRILVSKPEGVNSAVSLIATLESITLQPDKIARVVINERTGTIVAGGNVRLEAVTISHSNIKVSISTQFTASQPRFVELIGSGSNGIETVVVPNTEIDVSEAEGSAVALESGASIEDLIVSLQRVHVSTRDIISILQAVKSSGALHADLIIQ